MYQFLLTLLTLLLGLNATIGQSLTYRLISDSTITPTTGDTASGPAEVLRGTFIWSQVIPDNIPNSDAFATTDLNFSSASYTITLATNSQPLSATATAANGYTRLSVNANWAECASNPWSIGPFANGTFTGPANAPTRITFSSEGFTSFVDYQNHAKLYIDAILVSNSAETNQSTNVLTLTATAQLQGATNITATLTTVANPGKFSLTTKQLLTWLALDEHAAGNYDATNFPAGAKIAIIGSNLKVLGTNQAVLADVSDILTAEDGTNSVFSGKAFTTNSVYAPSASEMEFFKLAYDDSIIAGGAGVQFSLQGVLTTTFTDSKPAKTTGAVTETITGKMSTAVGDGNLGGKPFILTGNLGTSAKTVFMP